MKNTHKRNEDVHEIIAANIKEYRKKAKITSRITKIQNMAKSSTTALVNAVSKGLTCLKAKKARLQSNA